MGRGLDIRWLPNPRRHPVAVELSRYLLRDWSRFSRRVSCTAQGFQGPGVKATNVVDDYHVRSYRLCWGMGSCHRRKGHWNRASLASR